PVPFRAHFALITSVEPSILQDLRCLLGTFPVSGEDIWATNDDFLVFAQLHLNAMYRGTDSTRNDMARVVERADARGLRQPIYLQHRNAEHQEEQLCFKTQRR